MYQFKLFGFYEIYITHVVWLVQFYIVFFHNFTLVYVLFLDIR
jgi:hypothetical protein